MNQIEKWVRDTDITSVQVRDYKEEAFKASVIMAIAESPDLQKCLQNEKSKLSLLNAVRKAAVLGLSLHPADGEACLAAYNTKKRGLIADYQIMKNGMVSLALEEGRADEIKVDVVRENDTFTIESTGNGDDFRHSFPLTKRGKIIGFYAFLSKDGKSRLKYMEADDIKAHAAKYHRPNESVAALFKSDPVGYGKKTVVKALLRDVKTSKRNTFIDHAIRLEDSETETETKTESGMVNITPVDKGMSADDIVDEMESQDKPEKTEEIPHPDFANTESQGDLF